MCVRVPGLLADLCAFARRRLQLCVMPRHHSAWERYVPLFFVRLVYKPGGPETPRYFWVVSNPPPPARSSWVRSLKQIIPYLRLVALRIPA